MTYTPSVNVCRRAANLPFDQPSILVVDDEPPILALVQDILEEEGFTTLTAANGPSGLAIARTMPVALVLTDMMMPQMNGIEMCLTLRAHPSTKHIPVLLMSAAKPAQLNACFNGFVDKPFCIDRLVREVRQHLGLQQRFVGR